MKFNIQNVLYCLFATSPLDLKLLSPDCHNNFLLLLASSFFVVQHKYSPKKWYLRLFWGILHGLAEKGQICSGCTLKINYEEEYMNLDSTKNGNNFPLDILFHAYLNSWCASERGKTISFLLFYIWWKKKKKNIQIWWNIQISFKYGWNI